MGWKDQKHSLWSGVREGLNGFVLWKSRSRSLILCVEYIRDKGFAKYRILDLGFVD